MAVQQPATGLHAATPSDPAPAYWADDVTPPIALARFECCGRYVCRCGEDEGEGPVTR